MTYFISDINGEHELLCRLLDKLNFSDKYGTTLVPLDIDVGDVNNTLLNYGG